MQQHTVIGEEQACSHNPKGMQQYTVIGDGEEQVDVIANMKIHYQLIGRMC